MAEMGFPSTQQTATLARSTRSQIKPNHSAERRFEATTGSLDPAKPGTPVAPPVTAPPASLVLAAPAFLNNDSLTGPSAAAAAAAVPFTRSTSATLLHKYAPSTKSRTPTMRPNRADSPPAASGTPHMAPACLGIKRQDAPTAMRSAERVFKLRLDMVNYDDDDDDDDDDNTVEVPIL
ncbi:hypothetical protein CLCR_10889 [Cladophialophora carrionii]|uniref:Uncharacterized protein n=1 Tax=Cladophialophora carrionii TaxID=86049 RepID=A0A1C1CWL9_9EURO|nr:hypothetical protein CLCR_10889 [Cladophialophora carrionii]